MENNKTMQKESDLYFAVHNLLEVVKNQTGKISQLAEDINDNVLEDKIINTCFQIDTIADCISDKLTIKM